MTLDKASELLNQELIKRNPVTFTSTWIYCHSPRTYYFARIHLRTEDGEIDWDSLTRVLDRSFQKRWRDRKRKSTPYENNDEVTRILAKYKSVLYTLITRLDKSDDEMCDSILISLVRMAQKGNVVARKEVLLLIRYSVDEWIERRTMHRRWIGYTEQLEELLTACIRRYRYSGSFIGYVYRTLELTARGLPATYSLDEPILDGKKTRAENVVQDPAEWR
jgi:hypothetical protein